MERNFNPRSPYGERPLAKWVTDVSRRFQSTLPLRGATTSGRPATLVNSISIHAPLTGSDSKFRKCDQAAALFQSTLPLRGATSIRALTFSSRAISIHAPLTGSDISSPQHTPGGGNFNPRSPYGERLSKIFTDFVLVQFQSTLPLRGATQHSNAADNQANISIHAPLTGSDCRSDCRA